MILENVEGLRAWNIAPIWSRGRTPGISAFVRLKDEAEYVVPSLDSIADCDEIVIALQGEQTDGTDALVSEWAKGRPNVRALPYPFDSRPNGPGHDRQMRGSVRERAYFYNWTLAQTRYSHALKWDGDMVARDGLIPFLRRHMRDGYRLAGAEIASRDPLMLAPTRRTASEVRLFRVTERSFYVTGTLCERLTGVGSDVVTIEEPAFLHFKWAKARASATKAWPEGWEAMPHFQGLMERAEPVEPYTGPVPSVLNG